MATMHSNTLRSLFPPPRPAPKKNFIRENVRHIKEIQGLIQNSLQNNMTKIDKFRNCPGNMSPVRKNRSGPQLKSNISQNKVRDMSNKCLNKSTSKVDKTNLQINQLKDLQIDQKKFNFVTEDKKTDRYVQTERMDNLKEIYQNGIIKYPSANVLKEIKQKRLLNTKDSHAHAQGDSPRIDEALQNLNLNEKNFIKENTIIKPKLIRNDMEHDPNKVPSTYKRGEIPKYLKEEKDKTTSPVPDADCPPGHVLLPDDERKETLRVLRQSYADRIQELNSMPVRNDTLRMRKRKMEIEEELKKIDEGIKVFQRPKVFVKINA